LTEVDYVDVPPGLHLDVQRLAGQQILGNRPVDPPQQLLGLALVHDGDVLVAPHAHQPHDVRGLQITKGESKEDWKPGGGGGGVGQQRLCGGQGTLGVRRMGKGRRGWGLGVHATDPIQSYGFSP